MSDAQITFNSKRARKFFSDLAERGRETAEARKRYMRDVIRPVSERDIDDHFKNEMGPDGTWKKWSAWRAREAKAKGQSFILQDTGRLKNTVLRYRRNKEGITIKNTAKTAEGEPYAAIHNYGLKNSEGIKMPKRTFLWLSDKALDDIAKRTLLFMVGKL